MDKVSRLRGQADVSADSTLDSTATPAFVTAEDDSKFFSLSEAESTDQNASSVSIVETSKTLCNDYQLEKQIESNILSSGADIFDDTSCDGNDLIIDDKIQEDTESKVITEAIQEESAAQRVPEVVLTIDGVNVNAIDIGNGLYLYRRIEGGSDELAAVQVNETDGPEPSFKFLKVRENAEGNLEVYEEFVEVHVDYPEKVKSKLEKTSNQPMASDVAACSKMEVNKNSTPVKKEVSVENDLETKTERIMKFGCESRKSPIIGSYTPMSFHSTPNKEGVPLTKTMVDLQLHTNKLPDTSTKTIELNSDKKIIETLFKSDASPVRDLNLNENEKQAVKGGKAPEITIVSEEKEEAVETKDNNKESVKEDALKNVVPDVPNVGLTNKIDTSKIPQDLQNSTATLKDNVIDVNMDVAVDKDVTNEIDKQVENSEISSQSKNDTEVSESKDEIPNEAKDVKCADDTLTPVDLKADTETSEVLKEEVITECSKEIGDKVEKDTITEMKNDIDYKCSQTASQSVDIHESDTASLIGEMSQKSESVDPKDIAKVEIEKQIETKDMENEGNAKNLALNEPIKVVTNEKDGVTETTAEKTDKDADTKSVIEKEVTIVETEKEIKDTTVVNATVETKTESTISTDTKVEIMDETKPTEHIKPSSVGEAKLINNNIAVPFGKWTEANRQAFLNKIKETKVTHATSTTNQIKQPNDLNRRDVLKIISSARPGVNVKTLPKRDMKVVDKPLKNESAILPKKTQHLPSANIELLVKTTSSEFKGDMNKRTEMFNQDLIDKTIEGMLTDKTLTLKHGQDLEIRNNAAPEKLREDTFPKTCLPSKTLMNKTPVSLLDDIEQKMNELHGPPQVERLQPSSRYNHTVTSYNSNPEQKSTSTLPAVISFDAKLPQKTQADGHPNEEEILECEPVTGDSTHNDKTKHITSIVDKRDTKTLSYHRNAEPAKCKDKTIITERDFDKFARRNSVTCTDHITVNFDSSQHNVVKTVVESTRPKYMGANLPQPAHSTHKSAFYPVYSRNSLFRHNYPNMSSVPPDEAVDKSYTTSQFQVGYQGGLTEKRQMEVPVLRIEDKPVKVVYLEGSNDFVPYNLNVQGQRLVSSKPEPIVNKKLEINCNKEQSHSNTQVPIGKLQASNNKKAPNNKQTASNKQSGLGNKQDNAEPEVTDPESTTGSCNSVDSDFMFGAEDGNGSGTHRTKNTHQRKQILSTVNTSEMELIEPKDLMIDELVKKKKNTEDTQKNKIAENEKKHSKSLVPKKSYLLGRKEEQSIASTGSKVKESSSSYDTNKAPITDLRNTNEYPQQDAPVNTLDSLVKAAELLETQPDVIKSLVKIQPNESENSQSPILKRGRGRPRKYPPSEGSSANKSPSPQKKARMTRRSSRKSLSDHSDTESTDGPIKENWTMGKINEKIVCPICNKLFRSEEVVYKHVQHCSGPSPNRSESSLSKGKRSLRSSQSDVSNQDSEFDVKTTHREGRYAGKHSHEVIVIEDTPKKQSSSAKPHQQKPLYGSNNLTCDVCGKSFRQLSYYMKHKLLHKRDEPKKQDAHNSIIACEICNKQFRKPHHLVQHRLIHNQNNTRAHRKSTEHSKTTTQQISKTGFRCERCDKSFRKLHHLVEHRETHKSTNITTDNRIENAHNDPPYCEICNKTFRKLHHFIEHKETHSDQVDNKNTLTAKDIIHECPLCYMVFPNEHSLNKHAIFCRRKKRQPGVKRASKPTDESTSAKSSDENENEDEDIPVAHLKTNAKTDEPEEQNEAGNEVPSQIPTNAKHDVKSSTKRKSEDSGLSASHDETVMSKLRKVEASTSKDVVIKDPEESEDTEKVINMDSTDIEDKDVARDKNPVKNKESEKNMNSTNIKDITINEEVAKDNSSVKNKDIPNHFAKDKDVMKDMDVAQNRDLSKEKEIGKDKGVLTNKDIGKEKDIAKDKDVAINKGITKNKNSVKNKDFTKSKDFVKKKEKDPVKSNCPEDNHEFAKLVVEDVKRSKITITNKDNDKTDLPISSFVSTEPQTLDTIKSGETSEDEDVRYMFNPDYKTEFMRVSAQKRNSLQIDNPKSKEAKRRISLQHPSRMTRLPRVSRTPRLKVKPAVCRQPHVVASSSDESDTVTYSFPKKALEEPKKETIERKPAIERKPIPSTKIPKKRASVEHRCDCGELFMSEALLSRHHTMAHTPPRIRRRRSPAISTKRQKTKPSFVAKSTRSKAK